MKNRRAELEGRRIAAEMMEALQRQWEAVDLKGVPDNLITETMVAREPATLRHYLSMVKGHPEKERGFLCVLSDWIGAEMSTGTCADPRYYARYSAVK